MLAGGLGLLWLVAPIGAAWLAAEASASAAPAPRIEIRGDGTILGPGGELAGAVVGAEQAVRWEFGLPTSRPSHRGHFEEIPEVCVTRWEKDGIRYAQTVLITHLTSEAAAVRVLMVQLTGENASREYAEATAAFAMDLGEQTLELEWRNGLVHARNLPGEPVMAAIEIGAEGVDETAGRRLRFRGHMPPGTSGAMTIKIPLGRISGETQLNRLRDLEFDEEYRRVKKSWLARTDSTVHSGIVLVDW